MKRTTVRQSAPFLLLTATLLSVSLVAPPPASAASFDEVKGNNVEVRGNTGLGSGTFSFKMHAKDRTPGTGTDGDGSVVGRALDQVANQWGSFTADVKCVNAFEDYGVVVAVQTSALPPEAPEGQALYWVIYVEDTGKTTSPPDRAQFIQAFGGDPEVVIPILCTTAQPVEEASGDIKVTDGA